MTIYVALQKPKGVYIRNYQVPGGLDDSEMEIILQEKLMEDDPFQDARLIGWNEDQQEITQYMKQKFGSHFKGFRENDNP